MRDILLLLVIFGGLLATLRYPFVGIVMWAWFSLMTPHQMAFGAFGLQLNMIIAIVTIGALIARGDALKFRANALTYLFVAIAAWLYVSQANSLDPEYSAVFYDRFTKTLLFAILVTLTATSALRVNTLVLVFVLSLAFFAAKGALFTIVTLGQFHVQGLPNTILGDNNHMGIAIATTLPMIIYLMGVAAQKSLRYALIGLLIAGIFAIIGTQSRGAFLSLLVFGGFFWLRSRHKFAILALSLLMLLPAIAFMPSKWTQRMSTITEATEDSSFMGRVDAWIINTKLAIEHPLTGVGLRNAYQKKIAEKVEPTRTPRAAHSIYFEMLGGAGFVGLALYLAMLGTAFLKTFAIRRSEKAAGAPTWRSRFAYYAQISLAVFCVGGASTSMEMWDGYLLAIALIGAVSILGRQERKLPEVAIVGRRYSWRFNARRGATPAAPPSAARTKA